MSPLNDVCFVCKHPRHLHRDGLGICIQQSALPEDPCYCNLFRTSPDVCSKCNGAGLAWGPVGCPVCCAPDDVEMVTPAELLTAMDIDLVPSVFIVAMAKVMRAGIKDGRKEDDWMTIPRLTAANKTANLYIHMDAKEYDAVACNALILWWHFQRTKTAVTIVPGDDKESDHEPT